MTLKNDLLYLLLLFAVLDENETLTTTKGILIAVSIMLISAFLRELNERICCCRRDCDRDDRDRDRDRRDIELFEIERRERERERFRAFGNPFSAANFF